MKLITGGGGWIVGGCYRFDISRIRLLKAEIKGRVNIRLLPFYKFMADTSITSINYTRQLQVLPLSLVHSDELWNCGFRNS